MNSLSDSGSLPHLLCWVLEGAGADGSRGPNLRRALVQRFSELGPSGGSVSISGDLVRNANSQGPTPDLLSQKLWGGAQQ